MNPSVRRLNRLISSRGKKWRVSIDRWNKMKSCCYWHSEWFHSFVVVKNRRPGPEICNGGGRGTKCIITRIETFPSAAFVDDLENVGHGKLVLLWSKKREEEARSMEENRNVARSILTKEGRTSPDQRNCELFTTSSSPCLCSSLPGSLSVALRVWNHSEVVLVLSLPTSHLLNEPSIDRRHFVVSRFLSHLTLLPHTQFHATASPWCIPSSSTSSFLILPRPIERSTDPSIPQRNCQDDDR